MVQIELRHHLSHILGESRLHNPIFQLSLLANLEIQSKQMIVLIPETVLLWGQLYLSIAHSVGYCLNKFILSGLALIAQQIIVLVAPAESYLLDDLAKISDMNHRN